jgi:tRNA (guanine37-N1)-methyltransferase
MLRIDIITLFPEMVECALDHSIVQRARRAGLVDIRTVALRSHAEGRHKITDDTPCGGGGGMIMKPEPIAAALQSVGTPCASRRVVLTDPQGIRFSQQMARQWAQEPHLVFLCGHYEGVDERVRQLLVTDSVSIGDYVLTGGELPALVMTDAVVRLQPGALGDEQAPAKDSFSENLLDWPHYTRPREFMGLQVPEILFSGHHAKIESWRRQQQLVRTRALRPDLWEKHILTKQDKKLLQQFDNEHKTTGGNAELPEGEEDGQSYS